MHVHTMKYTCLTNIERNTSENVWLDQKFEPGTPASLVRCSANKQMLTLSRVTDFTNTCIVMASHLTEKRGNLEINNIL